MKYFWLLGILLFAFPSSARVIERLEASVNASNILLSDVVNFRNTVALRGQLDPLFGGTQLAKKGKAAHDTRIVDFLINETLILQQFPVKDAQVEQEINSIQAGNQFGRDALIQALRGQGFTFKDYFSLIRTSMAKRNLIDRDIRTKVHISDDDVKNYFYNEYSGDTSGRSYRIQMITVSRESFKTAAATYNAAKRAESSLQGGESFIEVAKRFSDSPSSSTGGDLGFLSEEDMSSVIRKQVKKLKVGEVTGLVKTSDGGYLILKLADLKTGEEEKLKEMTETIRGQLAAAEYQRQIGFWLVRQRQNAHIHLSQGVFSKATPTKNKKKK